MHSALPARLLVDDTLAYILADCEGGNPVSAPGVGGNVPLVNSPNQLSVALTLKWPSSLVSWAISYLKKKTQKNLPNVPVL